jgi:hypothetical protein
LLAFISIMSFFNHDRHHHLCWFHPTVQVALIPIIQVPRGSSYNWLI